MTLKITLGFEGREQSIIDMFAESFTAGEGTDEGKLIGGLVRDLLSQTPKTDIRVFCAEAEGRIIGTAVFTRLTYAEDPQSVFLLSPMAVTPNRQRKGVGETLLTEALKDLRREGAQIAITYGDPNYYKRVGFLPVTEEQVRAPLPLSQPDGWIGQSLQDGSVPVLKGPSNCVSALNRADIW
ncbi:MAG: N-acetyltransferase [Pseudomonadota bacterium]